MARYILTGEHYVQLDSFRQSTSLWQAFGQQGGTQQTSGFEADVMTGGTGADSFVLGNSSGSFYLDSGKYYPGVTTSPSDASWAGINNFDISKDQLVLSGTAGDYSAAFFKDIKTPLSGSDLAAFNQVVSAFTSTTGITPASTDILLYHGVLGSGNEDFIAGIHTTSTLSSAGDILNRATFV